MKELIPCKCLGCETPLMRPLKTINRARCPTCIKTKRRDSRIALKLANPEKFQLNKQRYDKNFRVKKRLQTPLLTPEQRAEQSRRNIAKAYTPETRAKQSEAAKKSGHWKKGLPALLLAAKKPENLARRLEGVRNSEKLKKAARESGKKFVHLAHKAFAESPLCQKGEQNINAERWRVRSPHNVVYEFTNLAHFVRQNPELFDTEDLVWRTTGRSSYTCRAFAGLSSLSPRRKRVTGTWKGWLWVGTYEHDAVGNNHLLGAQIAET